MTESILFTNFIPLGLQIGPHVCMLVENGKITALGGQEIPISDYRNKVDLQGNYLSPGFIDCHTHFLHSALQFSNIKLDRCLTMNEIGETLRASTSSSRWIRADGLQLSSPYEEVFALLNRIFPSRPAVLFKIDWHSSYVNAAALELLSVPETIADAATRSGFFYGKANLWLQKMLAREVTFSEREKAFTAASRLALSKGITALHALEGGEGWGYDDLDYFLKSDSDLEIVLWPQTVNIAWVREKGLTRMGGCLLLDGSIGSSTAAISQNYCGENMAGKLYFSDRALYGFVCRAHKAGLQLAFHAIGDRAVNQILNCYERVLQEYPRADHRHRIEHCELVCDRDLQRAAELGVYFSVQPSFDFFWGGGGRLYEKRLGVYPIGTNRFRSYLDGGIILGGGSDFDVTPMDPILGIHAAVNHTNPSQRISPFQALDLFTAQAAKFSFDENRWGKIAVGMDANFVLLSENPLSCERTRIKEIHVLATFVKGRCLYTAGF